MESLLINADTQFAGMISPGNKHKVDVDICCRYKMRFNVPLIYTFGNKHVWRDMLIHLVARERKIIIALFAQYVRGLPFLRHFYTSAYVKTKQAACINELKL